MMVVAADAQVHSLDTMFPLTVLNRSIEKKTISKNVDETHVTSFLTKKSTCPQDTFLFRIHCRRCINMTNKVKTGASKKFQMH